MLHLTFAVSPKFTSVFVDEIEAIKPKLLPFPRNPHIEKWPGILNDRRLDFFDAARI